MRYLCFEISGKCRLNKKVQNIQNKSSIIPLIKASNTFTHQFQLLKTYLYYVSTNKLFCNIRNSIKSETECFFGGCVFFLHVFIFFKLPSSYSPNLIKSKDVRQREATFVASATKVSAAPAQQPERLRQRYG